MKVLVSDFDESFYNENYDYNIKLVNDFVKQGNIFIIATGRNIQHLMKDIKDKDIPVSYYICCDGSAIYDQFLNIIYRKDLESQDVKSIYSLLVNTRNITNPYIDTTNGLTSDVSRSANRIVGYFINQEKALDLVKYINYKYPNTYSYLSKTHININNRKANKAIAVAYLQEHYNFDEYSIYTFGNDINDISLSDYDNSYILSSANDEIKTKFSNIVNSFEDMIKRI